MSIVIDIPSVDSTQSTIQDPSSDLTTFVDSTQSTIQDPSSDLTASVDSTQSTVQDSVESDSVESVESEQISGKSITFVKKIILFTLCLIPIITFPILYSMVVDDVNYKSPYLETLCKYKESTTITTRCCNDNSCIPCYSIFTVYEYNTTTVSYASRIVSTSCSNKDCKNEWLSTHKPEMVQSCWVDNFGETLFEKPTHNIDKDLLARFIIVCVFTVLVIVLFLCCICN